MTIHKDRLYVAEKGGYAIADLNTADGSIVQLLDLKNQGTYIADFGYVEETGMLYVPTFFNNTVIAYKINW